MTQRKLAAYLVERGAHYYFTVKANQPTLEQDIALHFQDRKQPDFVELTPPDHGRIETRSIWATTELNAYLNFPHVAQAFVIERETIKKTTAKRSHEIAYGITSRSPQQADPKRILQLNRGHWTIENTCHYVLDWNYDEDRCRIRTGVAQDGTLIAREAEVVLDTGAYTDNGPRVAKRTISRMIGPYRVEHCKIDVVAVYTNTVPAGSMRSIGGPQTIWALECHIDTIAATLTGTPTVTLSDLLFTS